MKNLLFIIIVFFSVPSFLIAQEPPKIEWQKCLGGTKDEDADPTFKTIVQTSDGGFIVAGRTSSSDGDVSGIHGGNSDDIWVIKLSSLGNIKWQKCLGGSRSERADCIVQTFDKGYIIAGFTNSNDGDVLGNHGGDLDGWVVKLDSIGNIQWQRCIGGGGYDVAHSIIQTTDSGFAIAGYTDSPDGDISGNHGGGDAWVAKLNYYGEIQWLKCYGGSSQDAAESIIQNSDGGYSVAGYTWSKEEGFVNHGLSDAYVIRLDSSGNIITNSKNEIWQKLIGGANNDGASCITSAIDGGFFVTGSTSSNDGDVSGNRGNYDAWVIKLDSDGSIMWQRCFGGSNGDAATTLINTKDSGYAFVGYANSHDGDISGNHGANDVWVVKLNSSGFIEWQECLGGSDIDEGFSIVQTKDGGYAICGRSNSNDGNVMGWHPGGDTTHHTFDIWVVKLSSVVNSVENSSANHTNFAWVYPNPSNDQAHLYLFQSQTIKRIQFYNLFGIQCFPNYQMENNLLTIDAHNLPNGSYIVRVSYLNIPTEEVRKFLHFR